ncbi:NAD-dependent epimerase/dehydratase family protein [Novosphingobium pentaromativorans]|uniref:Dihydroflavonol-4-reductase n=1 Tax=Novosphingobium pentaromativorans US6-1 TaxID=1088721 RepID=G6E9S1_9SPHN|nr:NAD-dependent epimerase/dehydratase family protein [Novosphingobium pentaromativorans]AIT80928.1 oxidoreductase [Novosphingobium pentaromativorans US6-1]EHJ61926.1 dihydroflavonol-4-reductase [Novosphingobium pentaromativorans US6-1]
MTAPRTVAITGATGFTGQALALRLARDGHRVRALARPGSELPDHAGIVRIEGDLLDTDALARLVEGADTVFHIAAMFRKEGPYEEFLSVNFEGTKALVAASRAAGVRRFVDCSTIGVHGSVADSPSDETAPFSPRDHYQETKLMSEAFCREEMARSGLEIVIIRPCAIYGPGDTRMLKMFKMVRRGTFFFAGDGSPNFHPVYIDDLVEAFVLAMDNEQAPGETFIIGGPRYLPLRDYVGAAARVLGRKPPLLYIPYRAMFHLARLVEAICKPLGIEPPLHRRRLSFFKHNRAFTSAKAQRLMGYRPRIDIDEGFRRTVAWYRETGLLPPK